MKTKKGISPLIATVLIIGFTIVLAALVMQWGSGLFEKIKGETSISSEVNLICSSGLSNLAVTSAKLSSTGDIIKVTVDNANEQAISGFLIRIHSGDNVYPVTISTALAEFGVATYDAAVPTGTTITAGTDKVGVMAKIMATDGTEHTCTNEKLVTITAA